MTGNPPVKAIPEHQLEARLEKMVLQGISNQVELAAAFNVSTGDISIHLRNIRDRWRAERVEDPQAIMDQRIRQIENIATLALNGYARSQQDDIQYHTTVKTCPNCVGEGIVLIDAGCKGQDPKKRICPECGGEGRTVIETVKRTGSPGDPKFLSVAKSCFAEAVRIQGLYPPQGAVRRLVSESREIGGVIQERVEEMYYQAPPDLLLKALSLLQEIKQGNQATDAAALPRGDGDD